MRRVICLHFSLLTSLAAPPAPGAPIADRGEEVKTGAIASFHIERAALRPGGLSESASFRLLGTVGQSDASVLHGPTLRIEGGFLDAGHAAQTPGTDALFSDGFEAGQGADCCGLD